jgi:hypothetical protein
MAAKITAVAGLAAAASATQVQTVDAATVAPPQTATQMATSADEDARRATTADDLARAVRIGGAKGCGCAPCWGPPAPPSMDWIEPELWS